MNLIPRANFTYSEETGVTTCILTDTKNNTYIGKAHCHPDDIDMKNEMTGSEIAYRRAYIQFLKHIRDTEIVPKLAILKHMSSCMEQAANFNPKDNNIRLMQRAIENYSAGAAAIRECIRDERDNLHEYMIEKGKLYRKIRANRKQAKNSQENN